MTISNRLLPIFLCLVGTICLSIGPTASSKPHEPEALIDAVKEADLTRVKELVAAGVDIDLKDVVGRTALHWAVGNHRVEIAQLPVGAGANVNLEEVAKLLVARGANMNLKSGKGSTALDWAMEKGHKDVAELLMSSGAEAPQN